MCSWVKVVLRRCSTGTSQLRSIRGATTRYLQSTHRRQVVRPLHPPLPFLPFRRALSLGTDFFSKLYLMPMLLPRITHERTCCPLVRLVFFFYGTHLVSPALSPSGTLLRTMASVSEVVGSFHQHMHDTDVAAARQLPKRLLATLPALEGTHTHHRTRRVQREFGYYLLD